MDVSLIVPAFIAGILTFLAPCTLPLVPGYLSFISGVSGADLQDPNLAKQARRKIFYNGLLYVIGFSAVFILLGTLFGLGGAALIKHRIWLSRIGGIFVIFFGFYMLNVLKLPVFRFLKAEKYVGGSWLKPGKPTSSFLFGSVFAFGWSPCIGPILGSVLLLASTSATVVQGAFLLAVFSLGLAVPFLLIAAGIGSVGGFLGRISKYLNLIGGLFLIFLGYLLVTNQFAVWLSYAYRFFGFINYDRLLDYL